MLHPRSPRDALTSPLPRDPRPPSATAPGRAFVRHGAAWGVRAASRPASPRQGSKTARIASKRRFGSVSAGQVRGLDTAPKVTIGNVLSRCGPPGILYFLTWARHVRTPRPRRWHGLGRAPKCYVLLRCGAPSNVRFCQVQARAAGVQARRGGLPRVARPAGCCAPRRGSPQGRTTVRRCHVARPRASLRAPSNGAGADRATGTARRRAGGAMRTPHSRTGAPYAAARAPKGLPRGRARPCRARRTGRADGPT
jgi:hypothetical protein